MASNKANSGVSSGCEGLYWWGASGEDYKDLKNNYEKDSIRIYYHIAINPGCSYE